MIIMDGLLSVINFFKTAIIAIWNTYRTYGDIWFYVTIAIIVVFPIFRRIIRSIRGGR